MMRKMMLFKLACAACRVRNIRADSNNLPRARVGKGADELDCERQRKECGYLQGVVAAVRGRRVLLLRCSISTATPKLP